MIRRFPKSGLLLLLTLFCGPGSVAQSEPEFELIRQEGDISIYERWITLPHSDPPIEAREVKSVFLIRTTRADALDLIKDEKLIKEWQKHVGKFKVYPGQDSLSWSEYSYHDIPWPVSDQDHFLTYQFNSLDDREWFVTFKSVVNDSLAPVHEDVTRMELSGSWGFKEMPDGRVMVTYRIISKPIGIPRFFTDPIIRRNLMSTIKNYIELLEADTAR